MDRKEQILARVTEIVAKKAEVPPSTITRETHFINDLNFDSLDIVDTNMLIEDEYDLSIPDDEAQNLLTIGALTDYIAEHSERSVTAHEHDS